MIKVIITLKRRDGMTHKEFADYQRNVHMPILQSIPETQRYMRRFVVSYSVATDEDPDPSYDSVVEAWFDSLDDLNALYASDNFRTVVDPDHPKFIDLSSVHRIIAEEDVVIG